MTPVRARWAISFADLCLLLLGFFVLLQAQSSNRAEIAASMRGAFGNGRLGVPGHQYRAATLFEPGEAVLRPAERHRLLAIGADAARDGSKVRVSSDGVGISSRRLDGWELAAARTAAIARAIREGGLDERRIAIQMPRLDGAATGQLLSVDVIR